MKEGPIIFSSPMVRAILNGSKTMTRLVINPQPDFVSGGWHWAHKSYDNGDGAHYFHTDEECAKRLLLKAGIAPKAGERRWVKEPWRAHLCAGRESESIHYLADGESCPHDGETIRPWKRSIFMPRWASRITLEITAVRVERLQDITEEDAKAEGAPYLLVPLAEEGNAPSTIKTHGHRMGFSKLWDSIQLQRAVPKGAFAWSQNPWVYAISFKRLNFK